MSEPIFAIQGDASSYHPLCARRVYGAAVVGAALTIARDGASAYDCFTEFDRWYESQPHDHEGNVLAAYTVTPADLTPCDDCLGLLTEPPRQSRW
jgi:hypothetical protein